MQARRHPLLSSLRKRRRGIAWALLPAVTLWLASGSACFAMLATATAAVSAAEQPSGTHAGHHSPADHEHHDHAPASTPAPADCPHCPAGHAANASTHATCSASNDSSASTTLNGSPSPDAKLLFAARAAPAAASPIPPLIAPPLRVLARPAEHVPLNIRHCVFLI